MLERQGTTPRRSEIAPSGIKLKQRLRQFAKGGDLGVIPVLLSLVAIMIFFGVQEPAFLSPRNLSNLLIQMTVTGTLAIGIVLVLLLGEVDLAVGSIMGVCAATLGVLMAHNGFDWWVAILVSLLVGALAGAFQGSWTALTGVPSFIVTLAGFLGFFGVQQHLLGSEGTINIFDERIAAFTGSYLPPTVGWIFGSLVVAVNTVAAYLRVRGLRKTGSRIPLLFILQWLGVPVAVLGAVAILNQFQGVPTAAVMFLCLLVIFDFLTRRTQFGRHIFAVGGNAEAARRAGINVRSIRIAVFCLTGFLAAIAGVLAVSRNQSAGTLTGGGTQMLEAIAAAVIGGTSLYGGRGSVWAALIGGLVIAGVSNGIELIGQSPDVKFITQGAILLMAVTIDSLGRSNSRKTR